MKKRLVALILAKKNSNRLPGKNLKDFKGKPMFMVNVRKCLKLFDEVYVSSDSMDMIKKAENAGAIGIRRGEELCGDVPNIPVYQHAMMYMRKPDGVIAVQANSPTIKPKLIQTVIDLMDDGYDEIMTAHPLSRNEDYHEQNSKVYGSIWGISRKRLENYDDPYHPNPDVLLVDDSIDIETLSDYEKALCQ